MAIEVKTLSRVLVDGVEAGDVVSVIANYTTRRAETLTALRAWRDADKAADAAKIATKDARIAELVADKAALQARVEELRAMTKDGRREKAAAELAALHAAITAAQAAATKAAAELAAIDA